ncbi:MAG: type II toxin-antitoxin system VapC family toxin [Desulfovermiculus sp.]|nr:type II toxin-antitoxin system VapC family toxin [Desulfovermiculus sp.]
MAYIDTSVLTAYYCPEPMSQQAQAILRNQKPTLSSLTELELFSAVARKVRTAELAKTDAHRIIAQFSAHVHSGLFVVVAVENQN